MSDGHTGITPDTSAIRPTMANLVEHSLDEALGNVFTHDSGDTTH
jgi:hypothetical protein